MKSKQLNRRLSQFGVSMLAVMASSTSAWAQCATDARGICVLENSGSLTGEQVLTAPIILNNSGSIDSIRINQNTGYVINNQAGGTIGSISVPASSFIPPQTFTAFPLYVATIRNAGRITGDITTGITPGGLIFVADGGTMDGKLEQTNFETLIYVDRGGSVNDLRPGLGLDVYVVSYESSDTRGLHIPLPDDFEISGYEALGSGTTITLAGASANAANEGIVLMGDGSFINTAVINPISFDGFGIPPQFFATVPTPDAIVYGGTVEGGPALYASVQTAGGVTTSVVSGGAGLTSFANQGTINGTLNLRTAAFTNSGTINLKTNSATNTVIRSVTGKAFSFTNSGDILTTESGARPFTALAFTDDANANFRIRSAYDAVAREDATIANSGNISGGLDIRFLARDLVVENSGTLGHISPQGSPNAALSVADEVNFLLDESVRQSRGGTATIRNTGTIDGNADIYLSHNAVTFENSNQINGRVDIQADEFDNEEGFSPNAASLTFVNSGTIAPGADAAGTAVSIDAQSAAFSFTNSGTVNVVAGATPQYVFQSAAVELENQANVASVNTVTNSGTISTAVFGGTGLVIGASPDDENGPPSSAISPVVTVTNSGSITASGGALLNRYQVFNPATPVPTAQFDIGLAAGLAAGANPLADASSVTITNTATGSITASGQLHFGFDGFNLVRAGLPIVSDSGTGMVAVFATAKTVTITNEGAIAGGAGITRTGTTTFTLGGDSALAQLEDTAAFPDQFLAGAIHTASSIDAVRNAATGTITGSVDLGLFDDRFENYGTVNGNVFLRSGDDTFVHGIGATFNGTADGGIGTDGLIFDLTGGGTLSQALLGQFINFETTEFVGSGTVSFDGPIALPTIALNGGSFGVADGKTLDTTGLNAITGSAGDETITNAGTIEGNIVTAGGDDSVTNGGTLNGNVETGSDDDSVTNQGTMTGGVFTGSGDDNFNNAGTINGTVDLANDAPVPVEPDGGAGDRRFVSFAKVALAAAVEGEATSPTLSDIDNGTNSGTINGNFSTGDQNDSFTNTATGIVNGLVELGSGDDTLINDGLITGNVDAAAGNDSITNRGTIDGNVAGSVGNDQFNNQGTITGNVDLGFDAVIQTQGEAQSALAETNVVGTFDDADNGINTGTITGSLTTGEQNDSFLNVRGAVIGGGVDLGAGNDVISNAGTINGLVTLGSGNDSYSFTNLSIHGAGVDGGTNADGSAEADTLLFAMTGTDAEPGAVALGGLTGFESMTASGGTAAITGNFSIGALTVASGRLIGLAETRITAPTISVAQGATFGSSGTVVGNIAVAGTLSPGSSPGTMTVTGNVALASGSTTLIEVTPTVSDLLLVSGTLNIASNATLTLTGSRPLTPGSALDLIVADGGITGSFTTTNRPATILGFVAQRGNRIQLLGQFQIGAGATPQVARTITYVNSVLTTGTPPAALVAALPSLIGSGGTANNAAFNQLHPESYASAGQLGIQTGLGIASAFRTAHLAAREEEAGLFTYVQGFGNWRSFGGNAGLGTSRARVSSGGVVGGIGFGSASASISGFIGYSDASQSINGLGSKVSADGLVAGVTGHYQNEGLRIAALVARDFSKADMRRALPGGATATSNFRLRGWTVDASAGYAFDLAEKIALVPTIGFTHVSAKRGAANEVGGGVFGLSVLGQSYKGSFIDGALRLEGKSEAFRPWATVGVRHQTNGSATSATAGFIGLTSTFTVDGVARKDTRATAGVGGSLPIGSRSTLYFGYNGEFGGGTAHNATVGVRIGF